jgi:hypothetical protein
LERPAGVKEEGLVKNTEEGEVVTRSYEVVAAAGEAPGLWVRVTGGAWENEGGGERGYCPQSHQHHH